MLYKVYYRKCIKTGKYYIGITSGDLEKRAGLNGSKYLSKNKNGKFKHPKLARAILKYGWDSFESFILEDNITKDNILLCESKWIEKFDSYENGYNSSPSGDYIYNSSKKVSMYTFPELEFIQEFNSAIEGAKAANLKTNTNIIRCCKGLQDKSGLFQGKSVTWRYSDETLEEKQSREDMYAKRNIKDSKRKNFLATHRCKKVSMYYCEDYEKVSILKFESIREASNLLSINPTHISDCCNKKRKSAGKYNEKKVSWEYI